MGWGEKALISRVAAGTASRRRATLSILAGLAILTGGPGAAAADSWVSEYPRVAAQAEKDCALPNLDDCRLELLRLAALLDNRPDVLFRLAKVEASLGHSEASLGYLKSYASAQLDFGDPAAQSEFHALRDTQAFQEIEKSYRAGLAPTGAHRQIAVAPTPDLVAEDLALDPRSGVRYLSSVHLGKVLSLDPDGHWRDFAGPTELSAWGIYAVTVDAPRARLWISTVAGPTSPPFHEGDKGRSAILRLNLTSRATEQRYELHDGQPHAFGDMALGEHGELYVSDGVGGGVYSIGADPAATLTTRVAPGALRSPQEPVPLPDGHHLLVADYSRGIAIVSLQEGEAVAWLQHPPELAVYGIDGLYRDGQTLIAIQNGTVPERLLIMQVDPSFTRVLSWRVALARAPGLGDPTHGLIRGDRFEFISNSGWDRVDNDGHYTVAPAATPPALWSIELRQ